MKSSRTKIVFVSIAIIFSVIIIAFLAEYAFNLYEENLIGKLPRMQATLEINVLKYIQYKAKNRDALFDAVIDSIKKEIEIEQTLDVLKLVKDKFYSNQIPLSKYFGKHSDGDDIIITDLNNMIKKALTNDVIVIQNRLEQYGVVKPLVLIQNEKQITVEFPLESKSENKVEELKQLLNGDAYLEFRILKDPDLTFKVMSRIDSLLAIESSKGSELHSETDDANMEMTEEEFIKKHPFFAIALLDPQGRSADAYINEENKERIKEIISRADLMKLIPTNAEFLFSAKPHFDQEGIAFYILYFANKYPELTGEIISEVKAGIEPTSSAPIITIEMNSQGSKEWARITEKSIGKRIAIMLDGVVYTAPIVKGKISGGRSQIDGMESLEEAKLLEIVLRAGSLPAPLDIISLEIIETNFE